MEPRKRLFSVAQKRNTGWSSWILNFFCVSLTLLWLSWVHELTVCASLQCVELVMGGGSGKGDHSGKTWWDRIVWFWREEIFPTVLTLSAHLPCTLWVMPELTWAQPGNETDSLSALLLRCHPAIWCLLSMASCYYRGHFPETKCDSKSWFRSHIHHYFGKNITFFTV